MSGKFLPYKYYGASGNVPEYGFKEGGVRRRMANCE
jgi:cyanate lyase